MHKSDLSFAGIIILLDEFKNWSVRLWLFLTLSCVKPTRHANMVFIKRLVILDVGSKVLCVVLVALQAALLDSFFVKFDEGNPGNWVWIAADVVIVLIWIFGLVLMSRNAHTRTKTTNEEQRTIKKCWTTFIGEAQYAYFSWIFYSVILVAKVWYMFGDFAENLTSTGYYNVTSSGRGNIRFEENMLYSSSSLKVILSITGPVFLLLAYAHHDEIHNSKYKLMMEKLGTEASLNVLDCLMLLALLFVDDTQLLLPWSMDHAIKFFTCCCYVLPVIPLFILRMIGNRKAEENNFRIILVVKSALYLFFVDVPLFSIRCVLWFRHDVDISTFVMKNVMGIIRGILDVYNELRQWLKSRQGGVATVETETAEPGTELQERPTTNL